MVVPAWLAGWLIVFKNGWVGWWVGRWVVGAWRRRWRGRRSLADWCTSPKTTYVTKSSVRLGQPWATAMIDASVSLSQFLCVVGR